MTPAIPATAHSHLGGPEPVRCVEPVIAPGIDPAKTEVTLDRGLLTVAGERPSARPDDADDTTNVYGQERFSGRFRRTVSLPEDIDPNKVDARYRDGVLHISIGRRESLQPKRIAIA